MMNTKLIVPAAVAAAIGGYTMFGSEQNEDPFNSSPLVSPELTEKAIAYSATPPDLESFPQAIPFEEILRFDVYPNWVKSRWPRVSTVPHQSGLSGMRVPLVTGISDSDLAGSLTYYFDDTHRVQKIEFHGVTNDASRLVGFMQRSFQIKSRKSLHAGLYVAGNRRNPTGLLFLDHPAIVNRQRPGQVQVFFEIRTPRSRFPLGQQSQFILNQGKQR